MKSSQKRENVRTRKDHQEMLSSIDFVSSRWLKVLMKTLPWTILGYALIMYILSSNIPPQTENRLDLLQITGFIAYAIIFFLAQILFTRTSQLILQLWERNIFHQDAKSNLAQFSTHLENLANHNRWQIIFLLIALVIPLVGILRSCMLQNAVGIDLLFCNYHKGPIRTSKSVFEVIIGICMVLIIWRIFVVAWGIRKLGAKFDMTPNWYHPDKSGGLLPIGTASFWIASILAVPGIYLGTWQILCSRQGLACAIIYFAWKVAYSIFKSCCLSFLSPP